MPQELDKSRSSVLPSPKSLANKGHSSVRDDMAGLVIVLAARASLVWG